MTNFTFDVRTRVVFGSGAIDSVGAETSACGRRALLVTGSAFARRSGLIDRVRAPLAAAGVEVTVYETTDRYPSIDAIDEGGHLARESGAECVIGVGGGGTLDVAKAVALAAYAARPIWDFTSADGGTPAAQIEGALPSILIPIIASTGSETNATAVVFNASRGIRAPITSPYLNAQAAIVDPTLTFTVPAHYTAVGAMNIISQMLETYLTSDEFAVTDRVTEGLIRVVMDSVSRASRNPDDLDARSNLSWAATLASTVATVGRGGSAPLRALAYPLTATIPIEHGQALSGLWPSFMRYALGNRVRLPHVGRFKRYALLGRQIFGVHETDDEVAAETTAYRFADWLRSMGMPTDLRGFDIDADLLPELARQAISVSGNGQRLTSGLRTEDIENIYAGSLRGEP